METQIHGALVECLGLGIVVTGPSGVGKSECVLELVQRGHRLVADDVVRLRRVEAPDTKTCLVGTSPPSIRHYIEIRGIGLLCVPDLYGKDSVLDEHRVDLVCRLVKWQKGEDYERIGLDRPVEELAGVAIPTLTIPMRPATSSATLVEVAGRDELQRLAGNNAAKRLDEKLRKGPEPQ
ncbi:MAG: HPr kinase/phosphorylase [Myxococcota bacterium]